jgi:hypothetical protein
MRERSSPGATIVDFQQYRTRRSQPGLPIDGVVRPRPLWIPARRPLAPEGIAHRRRMLRHLAAGPTAAAVQD